VKAAPSDSREFVRISVDLPTNPKLAALDNPAAGWAHVTAICYAGQHFTDGHFPVVTVVRMAGVEMSVVEDLASAGLWHLPSHDCGVCEQPKHGYAVVHDYLEHQRSAAEARSIKQSRREAGKRGAAARWNAEANGKGDGKRHADDMASATANAWQTDGKPMAEVEEEEEKKTTSSSVSPAERREDVEALCNRLFERLKAIEVKTAKITDKWRIEARKMLDLDERPLDQALRLIDWTTKNDFWSGNVHSMPTFRKQYDRLLIQARNEQQRARRPPVNQTDANIAAFMGLDQQQSTQLYAISGGETA
jgi:hypothetical protein